jgi:hypothetical protein
MFMPEMALFENRAYHLNFTAYSGSSNTVMSRTLSTKVSFWSKNGAGRCLANRRPATRACHPIVETFIKKRKTKEKERSTHHKPAGDVSTSQQQNRDLYFLRPLTY